MFDDSGKKIKGLATIGFVLFSAIIAILTLMAMGNARTGGGLLFVVGIMTVFVAYIGFLSIHAFGELVQETKENRLLNEKEVRLLQEISEQNKKLAALLATKEGAVRKDDEMAGTVASSKEPETAPAAIVDWSTKPATADTVTTQSEKIVRVDRSQRNVKCPYCDTVQLSNRYRCCVCGAQFVDKEL